MSKLTERYTVYFPESSPCSCYERVCRRSYTDSILFVSDPQNLCFRRFGPLVFSSFLSPPNTIFRSRPRTQTMPDRHVCLSCDQNLVCHGGGTLVGSGSLRVLTTFRGPKSSLDPVRTKVREGMTDETLQIKLTPVLGD